MRISWFLSIFLILMMKSVFLLHLPIVTENLLFFQHPQRCEERETEAERDKSLSRNRGLPYCLKSFLLPLTLNIAERRYPLAWLASLPEGIGDPFGLRTRRSWHLVVGSNPLQMLFLQIHCVGVGVRDVEAPGPQPSPPDTPRHGHLWSGQPQS